jgi:hypothetical protein
MYLIVMMLYFKCINLIIITNEMCGLRCIILFNLTMYLGLK